MVQQKDNNTAIFVASNIDSNVFTIANNGDVHIAGNYKKNNRDVIDDTSNYVLATSNILVAKANFNDYNSCNYISFVNTSLINKINEVSEFQLNYVLSTSSNLGDGIATLIYNMNVNDRNSSNYVLHTSNVISKRITDLTTDMIYEDPSASNKFIVNNKYNDDLEINGDVIINSNFIVNNLATLRNNLDITGDVNFTGDLYKNGMIYPNGKTYTGSSSILSQYSPIQTQFNMYKNVVEKSGSGWQFIDNNINI